MRKVLIPMLVAASVALGASVFPAGAAQVPKNTQIVIKKAVTGSATGGSTVTVTCEGVEADITVAIVNFDASGAPTTVSGGLGASDFAIVDGAWVGTTSTPTADLDNPDCWATETATGGATSTSWTCAFAGLFGAVPVDGPQLGCAAASGQGTGPVVATFGDTSNEVQSQTMTVVFTNAFPEVQVTPAPAVAVQPNFPG